MKNYSPQLKKIAVLVCLAGSASWNDVKGIKDTPEKIYACYLAKKLTTASDREIAEYFYINQNYMISRMEDLAIEVLTDSGAASLMKGIEDAYSRLESISQSA